MCCATPPRPPPARIQAFDIELAPWQVRADPASPLVGKFPGCIGSKVAAASKRRAITLAQETFIDDTPCDGGKVTVSVACGGVEK